MTYPLVCELDYRYANLLALGPDIEVLFIVGDSDPLAVATHLKEVRSRMKAKTWWLKIFKGDHSFTLWDKLEHPTVMWEITQTPGQIAGRWANTEHLDTVNTELMLMWNQDLDANGVKANVPRWTAWTPLPPDTPKQDVNFSISLAGGQSPTKDGRYTFSVPGRR